MKDLIIQDFSKGIGPSPHVGFGDMRNLDIYTIPGIARLNNVLTKRSSTTVTGLIKWLVKNPLTPAEVWGVDGAGVVYKSTNSGDSWSSVGGNTSGGSGQGLAIWKDYLFVPRSTAIDVYGPLSSSPAWTNSWKTIDADTAWHPMIVSNNDNNLYGGAGRYVFSLEELTTFAPGTTSTYSWTQQALDLPPNYKIKCIAELGNNLMLGTWRGSNIYEFKTADIFPWDRVAPSFGAPLQMNENGVNAMINVGNNLIVQAGIDGKLYSSNGVQAFVIAQIPNSIANIENGLYLETYPGSLINYKGRPFWGVSSPNSVSGMGVYSVLQTSKGNILNYEHGISTGNDGTSASLYVGALLGITRDVLIAGWSDASTYGIDKTDTSNRYTSYSGYGVSPFYNVGTPLIKRQFTQVEFQLAKPLASNEGIKIEYRTDLNASFTTIGTYDYATLGAVISHNATAAIPDCEFVQTKTSLTGTTTTPQLRSVTLR